MSASQGFAIIFVTLLVTAGLLSFDVVRDIRQHKYTESVIDCLFVVVCVAISSAFLTASLILSILGF